MHAALCEVGILQSSDADLPSMDDWGSCGKACGASALGVLCHDVLHQVIFMSFPNWSSMAPANDHGAGARDTIDMLRQKIQKKAWRSKLVLECFKRKIRIVLMSWLGAPIEVLQSELTYRDQTSKGLYDTAFLDELNPFFVCTRALAKLVHEGSSGSMSPIFHIFPSQYHDEILETTRVMGTDMGAQVDWRFLCYRDFPFRWAHYDHPGIALFRFSGGC